MTPAQRRHLRHMHCAIAAGGNSCTWEKSSDLFGAAHRIEMSWDDDAINGMRTLTEPGALPVCGWVFRLERVEDRWRIGHVEGSLFDVVEPDTRLTVAELVQRVGDDVSRLRGLAMSSPPRARRPRV